MPSRPYAWDFLDASQPWQGISVRGIYQPLISPDPDTHPTTPRPTTCFAPCDASAGWVISPASVARGPCWPPQPRAELLGLSLLLVGQGLMAPWHSGALVQHSWARRWCWRSSPTGAGHQSG